jgi:hypothetical protein
MMAAQWFSNFLLDAFVSRVNRWTPILTPFLLANEAPHLIGLNIAHGDVYEPPAKDTLALLAGDNQELQDRRVTDLGKPLDARHAVSFEKEPKHPLGFLDRKVHAIQVVFARISKTLWH